MTGPQYRANPRETYKFFGISGILLPRDRQQRDGWIWVVYNHDDITKTSTVFASACMLRNGVPSAEGQRVYVQDIVPTDAKVYLRVGIEGGPAEYRVNVLILF